LSGRWDQRPRENTNQFALDDESDVKSVNFSQEELANTRLKEFQPIFERFVTKKMFQDKNQLSSFPVSVCSLVTFLFFLTESCGFEFIRSVF